MRTLVLLLLLMSTALARPPLIPYPRDLSVQEGSYSGPLEPEERLDDGVEDPEGYVLVVTPDKITLNARTRAGLFYGRQTLEQLARDGRVPCVTIRDWPAMRWRGIQEDISRGPVPTLDSLKRLIRTAAHYKLNMVGLYLEHVYEFEKHPLIGPPGGSLTAAELKELGEYAERYHVTLLPELQSFGHLHHVLKHEVYHEVAELPHGHVLAPVQPESYALIGDLYAELVPLFPGPFLHIGADETWELGKGQSRAEAEKGPPGRLYLEHLRKVTEILRPYGKRLMFWGDIAIKYPDLLGILPKDVIAMAWSYDARDSYLDLLKPFQAAGLGLFVAPGASNWNRIYPNLKVSYLNIRNFVRDGQQLGAEGMLNTTWDDDGEALFGMTWPAVLWGAACAWQPGESDLDRFRASYDRAFHRSDAPVEKALERLARCHEHVPGEASDEVFWLDPFSREGARYRQQALPQARDLRLDAETALIELLRARKRVQQNQDTLDYAIFAARRMDALGLKLQLSDEICRLYREAYAHQGDRKKVTAALFEITSINGRLETLRDSITALKSEYRELWLRECRPYALDNVLVRYDNLAQLYQAKIQQVQAARRGYQEGEPLPSPESLGF